jgi:antitoxin VapB
MVEQHGGKVESVPALNIKNEEAYRLVKELADLEGKSMTTVVIEAVQEKLVRERKPRIINEERMQYILELGRRVRQEADPDWIARDQIADLYDAESGLPK